MENSQLRAFLAVAEELHFGRAAEKLHIAQPPLSRTIQQLERELGARLFERSTRSVRLTPAGEALLQPARAVLEAVRRAGTAVQSAEYGEVGVVRLAFAGVSTYRLVAEWARLVRKSRPGIQLELSSQNFAQPAMRKLVNRDADVALGRWDHIPAGVSRRVAAEDSLVLALPDTHPLAAERTVSFAQLGEEDFVALPPYEGAGLTDRLRHLAAAAGFSASVVQIAPDTQSALALVDAEVGCHLTLSSVARNSPPGHLAFVPVSDPVPEVNLQLVWRTEDDSAALRSVLSLVEPLLPDNAS